MFSLVSSVRFNFIGFGLLVVGLLIAVNHADKQNEYKYNA
jgi:hypothetical protein